MKQLGQTRSAYHPDHLLQTPDTFVRAPLPGMVNATAIVHIGPPSGAKFTEYTSEFEAGGIIAPSFLQRFVYVLDGELQFKKSHLNAGDFAYFPEGKGERLTAAAAARAIIIEKPYVPLEGHHAPAFFTGRESDVKPESLMGDPDLEVRALIPADASFDFAVNTMTFQPGAVLPMVEIHFMEHGLMMLSGGGIYRLSDHWYPVEAGDFIWMAPYCPQWFGALGKIHARYLIYKDWNRAAK